MVEREFRFWWPKTMRSPQGDISTGGTAIGLDDLLCRDAYGAAARAPRQQKRRLVPCAPLRNSATRANSGALLIRRHWCRKPLLMPQ
jgi:hypothetical protein